MWKQGSRSSALDRAQALLSAKRQGGGGAGSVQKSGDKTRAHVDDLGGSMKIRSVPLNTQTFLSDLSDLSSVSSAPEHGASTVGSATAWRTQDRSEEPTRDRRPPSSLGGGGSRFLKKAPPPATDSSQEPEPRYVTSSQRSSQNAALNRLAHIENRIRSRKQAQEQSKQGAEPPESVTSDLELPAQLSAQSSNDQILPGKRFLKKTTTHAVNRSNTAALSPREPNAGVRSRSRAADVFPLASLDRKTVRVVSGVSLESDEEDMKKLLGDSIDSLDSSFLKPGRPSSASKADKMLSKSSLKVHSTHPPAAVSPNPAPPCCPASPSHRSSPFRFTGQGQAHFSPSALSPSPSPPQISPSPPRRQDHSHRSGSPQRSFSSMSDRSQAMSLEELFHVRPNAKDPPSEISEVFSEDFKINEMTLDDLVPADPGFTEATPGREEKAKNSSFQQPQRLKQEDMLDYQSDFESESRTEPDNSASQVSEHLQAHGDEEEIVSEVMDKTEDSHVSHGKTEDDYSSTFSGTSPPHTSQTANESRTFNRSRDSRSSVSHVRRSRRRTSADKVFKDSAVQTQPDPLAHIGPAAGMSALGPAVGTVYTHPSPMVTHTLSADMVEGKVF
ncbi:uncharacterized protein C19orf44 homolog isoform X2 [Xyrichtys novacula]|uniref:Uncharacterized protein C19orf44 homolog isoform X2 n=1 Tax=Xyrichtys novacula TaxID=13765 RepID=A0AAV1FEU8_XYRNO|nr:uncharacterized protein C19orf44 homolog isoform X2 [Xyrichtys novacula]